MGVNLVVVAEEDVEAVLFGYAGRATSAAAPLAESAGGVTLRASSIEAIVASPARSGVPPPLLRTDVWPLCLPVIRQQRVGAHTEEPARACVNRMPSAAMASIRGV